MKPKVRPNRIIKPKKVVPPPQFSKKELIIMGILLYVGAIIAEHLPEIINKF